MVLLKYARAFALSLSSASMRCTATADVMVLPFPTASEVSVVPPPSGPLGHALLVHEQLTQVAGLAAQVGEARESLCHLRNTRRLRLKRSVSAAPRAHQSEKSHLQHHDVQLSQVQRRGRRQHAVLDLDVAREGRGGLLQLGVHGFEAGRESPQ